MFVFICVCTVHVLFIFGLNLSTKSFSFFWNSYSRSFDILALFFIYLDYIGIGVSIYSISCFLLF